MHRTSPSDNYMAECYSSLPPERTDPETCRWECDSHINQLKAKSLLLEHIPKVCTELLQCSQVSKGAKIRKRYNQVPHLTQDTNEKVTN